MTTLTPVQLLSARRAGRTGYIVAFGGFAIVIVIGAVVVGIVLFLSGLGGIALDGESASANRAGAQLLVDVILVLAGIAGIGVVAFSITASHNALDRAGISRLNAVVWVGFAFSLLPTVIFATDLAGCVAAFKLASAISAPPSSAALLTGILIVLLSVIDLILTPFAPAYAFERAAVVFA